MTAHCPLCGHGKIYHTWTASYQKNRRTIYVNRRGPCAHPLCACNNLPERNQFLDRTAETKDEVPGGSL